MPSTEELYCLLVFKFQLKAWIVNKYKIKTRPTLFIHFLNLSFTGQEDYDRLRPLSYPQTVSLCFSQLRLYLSHAMSPSFKPQTLNNKKSPRGIRHRHCSSPLGGCKNMLRSLKIKALGCVAKDTTSISLAEWKPVVKWPPKKKTSRKKKGITRPLPDGGVKNTTPEVEILKPCFQGIINWSEVAKRQEPLLLIVSLLSGV